MLHEVMGWPGPMTHRQYEATRDWMAGEWSEPDRADHYIMQLTAVVAGIFAKRAPAVDEFKIKFKYVDQVEKARNKPDPRAAVLGRMTMPVTRRYVDKEGNPVPPPTPKPPTNSDTMYPE